MLYDDVMEKFGKELPLLIHAGIDLDDEDDDYFYRIVVGKLVTVVEKSIVNETPEIYLRIEGSEKYTEEELELYDQEYYDLCYYNFYFADSWSNNIPAMAEIIAPGWDEWKHVGVVINKEHDGWDYYVAADDAKPVDGIPADAVRNPLPKGTLCVRYDERSICGGFNEKYPYSSLFRYLPARTKRIFERDFIKYWGKKLKDWNLKFYQGEFHYVGTDLPEEI